jgi:hypothetical protein
MLNCLPNGFGDLLYWFPEVGYGFHPRRPINYDGNYWEEYLARDASPMGAKLTMARTEFVRGFWKGSVVDIGIGGGRFCEEANALGYDINQHAVAWLKERERFCDPYLAPVDAMTCWDSLEHIPEPDALLAQVRQWLFVSLPIFESAEHCLRSRHYKPGEHVWYFSHDGFVDWCAARDFELISSSDFETQLGRDGIRTYAFRKNHG